MQEDAQAAPTATAAELRALDKLQLDIIEADAADGVVMCSRQTAKMLYRLARRSLDVDGEAPELVRAIGATSLADVTLDDAIEWVTAARRVLATQ
jgi:hypothetical protein